MYKRIITLVISIVLIFTISYLYFTNENKAASTAKHTENTDTQLINNVIEIEKNLVLSQAFKVSYEEFKNLTFPFIHSYYKDTYYAELEKSFLFDGSGGYLAESTKLPIYQYVSKVYISKDGVYKNIYIKIPLEGTTSQNAKLYIFKKDANEWRIFSVTNYMLIIRRNEPKKIIEKFANFNDIPIEYEYTKILE